MCDPVTAGMMIAGVASGAGSALGKKGGGGGGSIPVASMPGLQMSPVTGPGGPSGTTPATAGGGGGAPQQPAGGNVMGTGMNTSQFGGLLGKLLQSISGRGTSVLDPGAQPMAAPAGFNPLTGQ